MLKLNGFLLKTYRINQVNAGNGVGEEVTQLHPFVLFGDLEIC